MTTSTQVADAIAGRIAGQWPDRLIHRDVCPVDFDRPGFFLQLGPMTLERVLGLTQVTAQFELEIFSTVDEYSVAASEELMETQQRVLELFADEDLEVAGRHITVEVSGDGHEPLSAFVVFKAVWLDSFGGTEAEAPPMEEFEFHLKDKE